ncbi:MAG TPA: BON domain-containing protein, partial [Acidobacteriaceae bacterium]|nr:BON domain-containing protein [Acidobacteriaceae bacterium]
MRIHKKISWRMGAVFALAGLVGVPIGFAQVASDNDGDLQASVAAAIRNDAGLQGTNVKATTENRVVTLTGTVQTDKQRQEAETVAANVAGVAGIQDNITVAGGDQGTAAAQNQDQNAAQQEQAPPPPDQADDPAPPLPDQQEPAPSATAQNDQLPPPPPPDQTAPPARQPYPTQQSQGGYPSQYPSRQPYPNQYPNRGGYPQYPSQGRYPNPGYGGYPPPQPVSGPVTIPAGTLLQVRTSEALDVTKLQPGAMFQATAASDVFEGNVLAIPRGALVEGTVVDAKKPGNLAGSGEITLQITSINLSGRQYPLETDVWSSKEPNKAGYTATNTVGGAVVGAIIGGIVGRGAGAAAGALIGGGAG